MVRGTTSISKPATSSGDDPQVRRGARPRRALRDVVGRWLAHAQSLRRRRGRGNRAGRSALSRRAEPVNLGSGVEISIAELARKISGCVGYRGERYLGSDEAATVSRAACSTSAPPRAVRLPRLDVIDAGLTPPSSRTWRSAARRAEAVRLRQGVTTGNDSQLPNTEERAHGVFHVDFPPGKSAEQLIEWVAEVGGNVTTATALNGDSLLVYCWGTKTSPTTMRSRTGTRSSAGGSSASEPQTNWHRYWHHRSRDDRSRGRCRESR